MIRPSCNRGAGAKVAGVALGFLAFAALAPNSLQAQQKAQATAVPSAAAGTTYDARHEAMVQGTVVSYTTDSVTPPIGTHVLVRTGSGTLDVHLGGSKLLAAAKITLNPGDSVRLVGAEVALPNTGTSGGTNGGSYFAARILQKGAQSVTLRNPHGVVLKAIPRDPQSAAALRGVR